VRPLKVYPRNSPFPQLSPTFGPFIPQFSSVFFFFWQGPLLPPNPPSKGTTFFYFFSRGRDRLSPFPSSLFFTIGFPGGEVTPSESVLFSPPARPFFFFFFFPGPAHFFPPKQLVGFVLGSRVTVFSREVLFFVKPLVYPGFFMLFGTLF